MKSFAAGRKARSAPLYSSRGPRLPDRIVALFEACCASDRRACLFLVGLCLVALLPGFFSIPPVDRDGARFALISRHMVETGNLTETRLGWEAKRTQALGLHWLQAGVVKAAELVGVPEAPTRVWLYRVPSLAAAIGAVLLTFWAALAFTHRRAAVLAASLLASSVALGVGGRLAVPEVFLVGSVAAMMGAMGRLYLAERQDRGAVDWQQSSQEARLALVFWSALAFSLFTKGLMTPIYVVLPLAALLAVDRSALFLRRARSYAGLAVILVVVIGWFLLRRYGPPETQAEFVVRTLLGPVAGGYQGFTGLPGVYLLLFFALFWPAAPLAALAFPIVWKARRIGKVRFLLAWVVPVWLLFEILPTKVPAYVAPMLPAVAILIALAVERGALALGNMRLARVLWLWPLIGAVIAVGALLGMAVFDRTTSVLAWPLLLLGFFALVIAAASVREYGVEKSALVAIAGMLVSGFGVMQLVLPNIDSFWLAPRVAAAAAREPCGVGSGPIEVGIAGYNEPSFALLLPDAPRFLDGAAAADFLKVGGACRVVFVERRQEPRFARRAEAIGLRIQRGADLRGFDYNGLRQVRLAPYRPG
ncbi:4-amino-4-deoxy-L-arabinose transferase-like glycosyltransferase [Ancylobacter aquaticus]|uniref:4-amino-4-deoxy-L-arabinose transferase-like glycosyltransferase n=1 Tax=Ancylobacter aquaticus TaxID=100 RepID=A0A4R1IBK6_ANCAQ|nr:glycosyl transferase [Ancylobacter aquaticus]TCK31723.1 4-amino-4-deoxy-L-arabinose transferase-like glycosyltransferase [Ancylobacter aquaticus]